VTNCLFCTIATDPANKRIIDSNQSCFYIEDGFPIAKGHSLIILKRHIASFFETTNREKIDLMRLLEIGNQNIVRQYNPSGFNIGINDGTSAGQTIPHLHIHLIPRYKNDMQDPRGGVRWIFPEKAKYW